MWTTTRRRPTPSSGSPRISERRSSPSAEWPAGAPTSWSSTATIGSSVPSPSTPDPPVSAGSLSRSVEGLGPSGHLAIHHVEPAILSLEDEQAVSDRTWTTPVVPGQIERAVVVVHSETQHVHLSAVALR